ncbi:hypothetical protein [Kitasatospora sp. NPDC098663]|uniref:hypothetical protein n=1 Tax=Kitasatospora sp. NPDC098663 TaxID=3364096 RepID=UPI0037FF049F
MADDPREDLQAAVEGPAPVNLFEWAKARRRPRERPAGPRPVLTPEEHAEVPLTPEERQRRAVLLARVREANHPRG